MNQVEDLESVDSSHGVEIDLRSVVDVQDCIHLSHDAWVIGDDFEVWLDRFQELDIKGPIILNTKEDGLEERVIRMLGSRGIDNWFFLDTTIPTLVEWSLNRGEDRFALRLSRYEPDACLSSFRGKVRWIWVDCFAGTPVPAENLAEAAEGFKVCLVSPELQGSRSGAVDAFADLLPGADAICTKDPQAWNRLIDDLGPNP